MDGHIGGLLDEVAIKDLKSHDKTLDVLFNQDRKRYVVVQDRRLVPNARREEVWKPWVTDKVLAGCPAARRWGNLTPYESLLIMDYEGTPIHGNAAFVMRLLHERTIIKGDRAAKARLNAHNESIDRREAQDNADWARATIEDASWIKKRVRIAQNDHRR